jgi:hypothetical protein
MLFFGSFNDTRQSFGYRAVPFHVRTNTITNGEDFFFETGGATHLVSQSDVILDPSATVVLSWTDRRGSDLRDLALIALGVFAGLTATALIEAAKAGFVDRFVVDGPISWDSSEDGDVS